MKREGIYGVLLMALFLLLTASVALADPVGPQAIENLSSARRSITTTAKSLPAIAGNVSEIGVNTTKITEGWQGYYGNVSGNIVLDDASANSMYTWDYAGGGEVYATRNSTVNWTAGNIICAAIAHIQAEETDMNFNLGVGQDVDGINETFNETTHPAFNVSSTGFLADACGFTVSTYVDDAYGTRSFNETLLYSTSDGGLIYTAFIVDGGADGFKSGNENYDFQMLVAEDGHNSDASTTDYYFYVEMT